MTGLVSRSVTGATGDNSGGNVGQRKPASPSSKEWLYNEWVNEWLYHDWVTDEAKVYGDNFINRFIVM